jgi:hypothetical protein
MKVGFEYIKDTGSAKKRNEKKRKKIYEDRKSANRGG